MSFDLNGWTGALRHALRTLRLSPGFAATVVGTLGLAIGTITAVFAFSTTCCSRRCPTRTRNGSCSSPASRPGRT
jgi:hypothetical protein